VTEALDIEKLVGELEVNLDRLRALYEQYFMGLEKIEPMVVRKDLDRRIHALRKEQIRNTAQRFRFQMILQRYSTYQSHWQRICREIENGTYKRHVVRARQRFAGDTAAARRRSVAPPAPAPHLTDDLAAQLAELDREFAPADVVDELDVELLDDTPIAPPVAAAPPDRPSQPGPVWRKAPAAQTAAPAAAPPAPAARPAGPPPRPILTGKPPPPRPGVSAAPPPPRPGTAAPPAALPPPRPAGAAPPAAPPAPRPAGHPAPPPPALARPAPAAPVAARPAPAAARAPGEIPDERVRQIYAQYVEAKRRQNESTAAITYDAVAKTLRDSSARLREKHGKPVDFEVAVKDGKAILKPVLK
jgi:hypothetical protein